MAEAGHRAKAGQSVRLLDIPAARNYGCFDDLHGFASGAALSDSIKREGASHYGHPGRAFLERLSRDVNGGVKMYRQGGGKVSHRDC
jgi:putative DNA primase/helicase